MIRKNVAGQYLWAQINSAADGSALTSAASFHYDAGTYGAGSGTLTHRGGGLWRYALTQSETNVDAFGYQFAHAAGVAVGGTVCPEVHDATSGLPAVDVAYVAGTAASPAADPVNANVTSWKGDTPADLVGGRVAAVLASEVTLAAGTANAGGSGTSFAATVAGSTLSGTAGAYVGDQKVLFQAGALNGQGRPITGYTVSGGTATITVSPGFPAAPGAGDAFVIG